MYSGCFQESLEHVYLLGACAIPLTQKKWIQISSCNYTHSWQLNPTKSSTINPRWSQRQLQLGSSQQKLARDNRNKNPWNLMDICFVSSFVWVKLVDASTTVCHVGKGLKSHKNWLDNLGKQAWLVLVSARVWPICGWFWWTSWDSLDPSFPPGMHHDRKPRHIHSGILHFLRTSSLDFLQGQLLQLGCRGRRGLS